MTGAIVHIAPGSGIIKRCPVEGCNRALSRQNYCPVHEIQPKFVYDLRIKGWLDDGEKTHSILLQRDAVESLTGINLAAAQEIAENNPLGMDEVFLQMRDKVLGRYITCKGREIDNRVLVNSLRAEKIRERRTYETAEPGRRCSMSTNASDMPRREGAFEREPARRVFAGELRECRYQFKDGEDEKSPTFVLLPTGRTLQPDLPCRHPDREDPAGRAEHLLPGPRGGPDRHILRNGRELPARGNAAAGKDRDPGICRRDRKAQPVPETGWGRDGLGPC